MAKRLLGIDKEGGIGKYLGLPEHFGRKKKDLFTSIVDRIRQKALSWSNRFLSGAGKMTLLKSVLSAIPSYAMSCFQLPMSLCKRIQSALTRFWWDTSPQKKSMCWVSWEKLSKSKQSGGLGFRDVQDFNSALLGKLAWRIAQNPESLLAKVLLGKYCREKSFLDVNCPNSASHGWRSVIAGRDLLKQKLGWVIGNGESVNIWQDPWLSLSTSTNPMGPATLPSTNWKVKDLFIPNTVEWNVEKIHDLFPMYIPEILAIKPSRLGAADKLVWLGNASGIYTTKSGYHTAKETENLDQHQNSGPEVNWQSEVWNIRTAPKVKIFLWKALQGALPIGSQLLSRTIASDVVCCRCGGTETIVHLLFNCPFARKVWSLAPTTPDLPCDLLQDVRSGLVSAKKQNCLPPIGLGSCPLYPWICWNIWKSRNQKMFNDRSFSEVETLCKSIKDAREWQDAQEQKGGSDISARQGMPAQIGEHPLTLLCRTDAAWRSGDKAAGLGWTFQDSLMPLPSLHSASCGNVASPLMAEALACRLALMEATRSGVTHLKMESDCQNLVQAINSRTKLPEIHGIMADIFICIISFVYFDCSFIPRLANSVADGLAKHCLTMFSPD